MSRNTVQKSTNARKRTEREVKEFVGLEKFEPDKGLKLAKMCIKIAKEREGA